MASRAPMDDRIAAFSGSISQNIAGFFQQLTSPKSPKDTEIARFSETIRDLLINFGKRFDTYIVGDFTIKETLTSESSASLSTLHQPAASESPVIKSGCGQHAVGDVQLYHQTNPLKSRSTKRKLAEPDLSPVLRNHGDEVEVKSKTRKLSDHSSPSSFSAPVTAQPLMASTIISKRSLETSRAWSLCGMASLKAKPMLSTVSFNDLPTELRLQIWEYALDACEDAKEYVATGHRLAKVSVKVRPEIRYLMAKRVHVLLGVSLTITNEWHAAQQVYAANVNELLAQPLSRPSRWTMRKFYRRLDLLRRPKDMLWQTLMQIHMDVFTISNGIKRLGC